MEQCEQGRIKVLDELTVEVRREDHTLMNPLKWAISNNWSGQEVEFCGYNVPHPSDDLVHFTVQLADESAQSSAGVLGKMVEGLDTLMMFCDKMLLEAETD
ncbi:DNA-directed RNA polymerases I and III subunit RPAC2 [Pancytospora philotis]|nr:DNA-directed RNA polymerases I and III subunit RPAC2 [Pancytospora philotis]